jgi:hypothetical protein
MAKKSWKQKLPSVPRFLTRAIMRGLRLADSIGIEDANDKTWLTITFKKFPVPVTERSVADPVSQRKEWLIFNASNGQFWGPDSGGYFGLWGAGLYRESDARRLASDKDRNDQVHHIREYKDQIANMRGAFERLSAALAQSGRS